MHEVLCQDIVVPRWQASKFSTKQKKKNKEGTKRTMEINLDTVGKKNPAHCPSQPFKETPTKQFPVTFSGIPIFSQQLMQPKQTPSD